MMMDYLFGLLIDMKQIQLLWWLRLEIFCQKEAFRTNTKEIEKAVNELTNSVSEKNVRKQKEMAAQAKMKEMLTSDAGEGDNQKSEK